MLLVPFLIFFGCIYLYIRLGKIERDMENDQYPTFNSRPYIDKSVNITHDNRVFNDNRTVTVNQLHAGDQTTSTK